MAETGGLSRAFTMKTLMVAVAALIALSAGDAWAFENSRKPAAMLYFSLPFGAQSKREAAPKLGISFGLIRDSNGNGLLGVDPFSTTDVPPANVRMSLFDFGVRLDDAMTLNFNGIDVGQLGSTLYASDDESDGEGFKLGWAAPLAVSGAFLGVYILVKDYN